MFKLIVLFVLVFSFEALAQEGIKAPEYLDLQLKMTVPSKDVHLAFRSIYYNVATSEVFALILAYRDGVGVQVPVERTIGFRVAPYRHAKSIHYYVIDPDGVLGKDASKGKRDKVTVGSYANFRELVREALLLQTMVEKFGLLIEKSTLRVMVEASENGEEYTFQMHDPALMGHTKLKVIRISRLSKNMQAIFRENPVYPTAKRRRLDIKRIGSSVRGYLAEPEEPPSYSDHIGVVRLDKERVDDLLEVAFVLRTWAQFEHGHFLRRCRCTPQLTVPIMNLLQAFHKLSIDDFLAK